MSLYLDLSTRHADVRVLQRTDRFIVSWKQGKRRQRKAFTCPTRARNFAHKVLESLEAGREASRELDSHETLVRVAMAEREHGMTLDQILRSWKRLKEKHKDIKEASKSQPSLDDMATQYLDECVSKKSTRHYQTVESHLRAYRDFGKEDPTAYLSSIEHPVTSNNHRATLSALYNWATEKGLRNSVTLPKPRKNDSRPEIGFITPDRLTTILRDCPPKLAPTVAIAALAGVRVAEIERLRWKDIDLLENVILLSRDITKTGNGRVVEIGPRLWEILDATKLPDPEAKVCPLAWPSSAIHDRFPDLPPNALRHSYATYALALNRDAAAVSEQLGNSPRILKAHYAGLATKAQAELFFGLTTPQESVASEQA